MPLFDDSTRTDLDYADYGESHYAYLNRSARPEIGKVRAKLNEWFDVFPSSEHVHLKSDFQSSSSSQFFGGFTELYCHALLKAQQYDVLPHPDTGTTTRLDFDVHRAGASQFCLECTVATEYDEGSTANRLMSQVLSALNTVHSPNFFLGIIQYGAPSFTPSLSQIKRSVDEHLRTLDPDSEEFAENAHLVDEESPYYWEYTERDWKIGFFPIAKRAEARGRLGVRLIGTLGDSHAKSWDSRTPIMRSLKRKATRYGDLQRPYVIAVNAMDIFLDDEDALDVLFGTAVTRIHRVTRAVTHDRNHDGFWRGPRGAQHTRVSAVLILPDMGPWSIASKTPVLWHNPWAANPLNPDLWALPQKIMNAEQRGFDTKSGTTSAGLLGISPDWLND